MNTLKKYAGKGVAILTILGISIVLGACGGSSSSPSPSGSSKVGSCQLGSNNVTDDQIYLQCIDGEYMRALATADPFPLQSLQNGTDELANLSARIQRLNDPNRIGYVGIWNANGTLLADYEIKGKVSSTGSEMTNTENAIGRTGDNSDVGGTVVSSPGDDGSFGPEECQGNGIFFFTAQTDALVEVCVGSGIWQYSDAPFVATSTPQVVINEHPTTPIPVGGVPKGRNG